MSRPSTEQTPARKENTSVDVAVFLALLACFGIALSCLIGAWVGDRRFILEEGRSVIAPLFSLFLMVASAELALLHWGPRGWRLLRLQAWLLLSLVATLTLLHLVLLLATGASVLPWDRWLISEIASARGMMPTPIAGAPGLGLLLCILSLGVQEMSVRGTPWLRIPALAANALALALSLFSVLCAAVDLSPLVVGTPWTGVGHAHLAVFFLSLAASGHNRLWSAFRKLIFGLEPRPGASPEGKQLKRQNRILSALLLMGAGTLFLLALSLRSEYRKSTIEIAQNLRVIAGLKASEIETWLNERVMDARFRAASPTTMALADRRSVDAERLSELALSVEYFRETYGYAAVLICSDRGEILFSSPQQLTVESLVSPELIIRARDGLQPRILGFHQAGDRILLSSTAPLPNPDGRHTNGFVVLIIDPGRQLLPMVERWPSGETSGMNQLLEIQGREVLHLLPTEPESTLSGHNIYPHEAGMLCTAPTVSDPAQPLLKGRDHRGILRLGVAAPVKGTPWHLVSSVAAAPAYAVLRGKMLHEFLSFLLLLGLVSLGTGTLWRLRHERSRAIELEAQHAKDEMAKRVGVLMRRVNDGILLFDHDMRVIEANDRAMVMYGYDQDELLRLTAHDLRGPEARDKTDLDFHAAKSGQGVIFSTVHRRKDGSVFPVEVSSCPVELEGRRLVISTIRDISERQAQMEEIEDLNRMFLVISRINQAILRQKTRRELYSTICSILVETGQFKIAWVGLLDPGTRLMSPIAVAGDEFGYVRAIHVSADSSLPEGLGPSGTALREQRPVVCEDFLKAPYTAPWREEAARSGIRSSIALPLRQEGRIVGMLNVYAKEVNFFNPQKVKLLEKAANDVSFAMDLLASNERRQLTEAALVASERRLTFLLSSTPAVIYSIKAGGNYATTFISRNVQAILGHPPESFTQSPDFWSNNVHPDDLRQAFDALGGARPGEPVVRSYRFRHKDGSYRWMHDEMRVVLDDAGTPVEYVGYWADISESMRAADELRSSRDRLAKAEQMASLGNWEFDHASGRMSWSEELYRIFEIGERQTDSSREAMLARVHPEDRQKAGELFQQCVLEGKRFSTGLRLLFPDGRIKYVEESAESFPDSSGHLRRSVGAIQDLTARKQVEIELHELVKQLRVLHIVALALDSPDKDLDEIIRTVAEHLPSAMRNPGSIRVTVSVEGCSRSAGIEGTPAEKYRTPITINGREAGSIVISQEDAPKGTRSPLLIQERETVESVAKSLGFGLGARESLATIRRFNAELEKKVEERTAELALRNREIQGLLNAIPDLVLRIRGDGCIIDVQQAHDSSALLTLAAANGQERELHSDNPLIPICLEAGREALRLEKTVTREELLDLPSGQVAIEFRAAPIDTQECVVFVRDITTRKQLEKEMEAMLEKERQVSELKSRFISVTSHEFRTPMAATMGAVEILRNHADKLSAGKREELFVRITSALQRMTTMLDDILTLSRLGASRLKVQIADINMEEVVRSIIDEVRLGDQNSHHWQVRTFGEGTRCESDVHLLHSILTNLLSNACRYSPQGTTITVNLRLETALVCLEVEDEGIGVPEKDWHRIFEPFERGSNVGMIKGTGLGLNIVKGMSELLGGSARIEKASGTGSRFVVTLPRFSPAPVDGNSPRSRMEARPDSMP